MNYIPETSRRFKISRCLRLIALAIFFLATSCATHTKQQTTTSIETESLAKTKRYSDSHDIEKLIYDEYMRWKGTRHRLGGTSRGGIDCSGFVRAVYKNVFNIELPRTTRAQVKQGTPVKRKELRAGDLVFFKPLTYPRHVGIFLSGKDFVHASKSKGVIISQIDPYYWGKYYWRARRFPLKSSRNKKEGPLTKAEYGKASYYTDRLHGKRTASGEPYDRNKLTAAHKRLPFGIICKVTNLANGKSVQVRINDRGPFVKGRIIDLSYNAISLLDGIHSGIINVKVEVLE